MPETMMPIAYGEGLIRTPGYPFAARDLFEDLRRRLAAQLGEELSFERLGQLIGKSKSTVHHWFTIASQPQVLAYMCLLERLSSSERNAFVEAHCRVLPSLHHPWLAHAPAKVEKLLKLLRQRNGLTLICGAVSNRTFLVTALGHAYRGAASQLRGASGIDLHRPARIVPVESVNYIDGTANPALIKELTSRLWLKVATASSGLVICNGVWSAAPDLRQGILQCSKRSHVLLAEARVPDLGCFKARLSTPLHILTVSAAKRVSGGIKIHCRRIKTLKGLKNASSE